MMGYLDRFLGWSEIRSPPHVRFRVKRKPAKPKAAKKASTGAKRVSKSRAPDHAAIWNDLKDQIGTDSTVPYSMKSKFELANSINHPKFGIGFVTNATGEKVR